MDNFRNNGMEIDMTSYMRNIKKAQNKSLEGVTRTVPEAMDDIREYLQTSMKDEMEESLRSKHTRNDAIVVDKEFLREKTKIYRTLIEDCITKQNIVVVGYENRMQEFIELMVSEFVGYGPLQYAFLDPGVSDIYVINYNTIFVEKDGVNQKYPFIFNNPKHCEDTIKRFVSTNKKELNNGSNKIVNFELYEDRGCAISPVVSTKGYSLTMRKHKEDHITRDDLLNGTVIRPDMANLLDILIQGETNLICAGLTGSGKTTTIRALLDYSLKESNKRALVCEDTQELFLKNEHTLSLVSFPSEDPAINVSLRDIVYTALRLKPKYIIVGEVRGPEAEAAVEAMSTGHSTIFTMHAGTSIDAINRLETKYLMVMPSLGVDVVERIIGSAVDYIFFQDNIPGIGRKVTIIDEISYDYTERRVKVTNVLKYDFDKKDWVWNKKFLGRDKIDKMLRRGVPIERLREFMDPKEFGDKIV